MLDGLSLDQLRTFVMAVDEGSFSAAARKLHRAQSAVSDLVAGLEAQLGVTLFDRSGRYPKLTEAGHTLLGQARGIIAQVDFLKAQAKGISSGIEPQLSVVVDVLFPIAVVAQAAQEFGQAFPGTPLRIFVEALGATYQAILNQSASVGITALFPEIAQGLMTEHVSRVEMVMVAAPAHPLAALPGAITQEELAKHVQLVLTDRSTLSAGVEFSVLSASSWRLSDLFAKHAFLLHGLGWGGMPLHIVQRDLDEKRLIKLQIEGRSPQGMTVPMVAAYPTASPPGPAGRWFVDRIKALVNHPVTADSGQTG